MLMHVVCGLRRVEVVGVHHVEGRRALADAEDAAESGARDADAAVAAEQTAAPEEEHDSALVLRL